MENYPLPQPEECIDFQNNTMLINEGSKYAVIDYVGRIFKGENCGALAKEVFNKLVQIENRKLIENFPEKSVAREFESLKKLKNEALYKKELLKNELGVSLLKESIVEPKYWIKDTLGQENYKANDFEKVFSIFYSQILNLERNLIKNAEIINLMGNLKLMQTKGANAGFYVLDHNDNILIKRNDRSLADEAIERIYINHAYSRSIKMGL